MLSSVPAGIGEQLKRLFRETADDAVRELAEATLDRARRDAPPSPPPGEDPDVMVSLRDSGRVEKITDGVYDIIFDAPYAAKQHEAMQYEHPHGGGAKYLERNVLQAARRLEGALAAGVRVVTTRGDRGTVRVTTRSF